MKQLAALTVLILFNGILYSQTLGMTKQQIIDNLKKKYPRNTLIVQNRCIVSGVTKTEFRTFFLDSTNKCCRIEQHGPADAVDFYKSTYSMTMQRMNDTTWCLDKENIRTMVNMKIYKDSFVAVTSQHKLGFLK